MPNTFGFREAVRALAAMPAELSRRIDDGLADCALIVEREAKKNIQHGRAEWPALAQISLARRVARVSRGRKLKYANRARSQRVLNRTPLLDTGDLMRDIHHEVEPGIAVIGCSLKYAPVHEFGCVIKVTPRMRAYLHWIGIHLKPGTTHITIPKRAFLQPALEENIDQLRETMLNRLSA